MSGKHNFGVVLKKTSGNKGVVNTRRTDIFKFTRNDGTSAPDNAYSENTLLNGSAKYNSISRSANVSPLLTRKDDNNSILNNRINIKSTKRNLDIDQASKFKASSATSLVNNSYSYSTPVNHHPSKTNISSSVDQNNFQPVKAFGKSYLPNGDLSHSHNNEVPNPAVNDKGSARSFLVHQLTRNRSVSEKNYNKSFSLAKGSVAEFLEKLSDQEIIEGDILKLHGKIKGQPVATVTWKKDGNVIKTNPYIKNTFKDDTATLTIRNASLKDSGEYSIDASNTFGVSSSTCHVNVIKKPTAPVFKKRLQTTFTVVEEANAEFIVHIESTPEADVKWTYKNNDIADYDFIHTEKDNNQYKLVIENCELSHKGRVKIIASNIAGSITCFSDLNVKQGPPKLKAISDLNSTGLIGSDLYLEVEGPTDGGKYKVEWMKGSRAIFRSTRKLDIHANGNQFSLCIKDLQESDHGVYKCTITGSTGQATQEFNVVTQG